MGYTAVAFADPGGLPNASLPEVAGIEDQELLPELKMSDDCFEGIVGKSPAIKKVLEQVAIVAPTDATVLLHGETGTGKELVAKAIHNLSCRRGRALVRMNCAAIPSGLLESDLFGHEKGAFTGALIQKKGRFELADGGSLFLDEIGDISLELQPKLLRAVQEREFERLGSARTIQVDVRMIVATHRDLPAMIRDGKFREDLFYRFNVFPIEIPPLRERREDIPLLASYFMKNLTHRMGKKIKNIAPRDDGVSSQRAMERQCSGIGQLHRTRRYSHNRRGTGVAQRGASFLPRKAYCWRSQFNFSPSRINGNHRCIESSGGSYSGQRGSGRTARPEANDSAEQDAAA